MISPRSGVHLFAALVACVAAPLAVHAAPYGLTFEGQITQQSTVGQLVIGDAVSGQMLYDTDFEDRDSSPISGNYPGPSMTIQVQDLYFKLAGVIYTSAGTNLVFSRFGLAITQPPSVTGLLGLDLYIPLSGGGKALPTSTEFFASPVEVYFNFLSVGADGTPYYDVATATITSYTLTPLPEPSALALLAGGAVIASLAGVSQRRARKAGAGQAGRFTARPPSASPWSR